MKLQQSKLAHRGVFTPDGATSFAMPSWRVSLADVALHQIQSKHCVDFGLSFQCFMDFYLHFITGPAIMKFVITARFQLLEQSRPYCFKVLNVVYFLIEG